MIMLNRTVMLNFAFYFAAISATVPAFACLTSADCVPGDVCVNGVCKFSPPSPDKVENRKPADIGRLVANSAEKATSCSADLALAKQPARLK